MERLNADIIFMVCCYLDLGSLSSLAAALPHWSSVIFGTLKTRVWAIKMRILPQFTTVEYCSMLRSKCSTSRDGAEEESPRMNLVLCDWEGLQASIWKHVPFDMLKIAIFDVTQFGASELPQKLNKALRKITTSQLSLKFETRTEARKVLQTISFNPGSTIYLHELSFQAAKEPMLQQCSLENIRDLWFSGDVLSSDLSLLLGSRIPSLCVNCDCLRQSKAIYFKLPVKRPEKSYHIYQVYKGAKLSVFQGK
ncbi:unnamed protein product [Heligmosomoides polygyrus]|uniref:F-box domain-containing protein n=1 Tax=Heligmosomoides polygyrus TaxID=6339 RepID=A0A183G468_HELPZ|nr:unnamed protein product [Heligmosomoides polygyrus]